MDTAPPHEVGKEPESIVIDGVIAKNNSGVNPDEVVMMWIVVGEGIDDSLSLGTEGDTEVGQFHIILRLFFKISNGGSSVVDKSGVKAVVRKEVAYREHCRRLLGSLGLD
jgi:hypothetical protein